MVFEQLFQPTWIEKKIHAFSLAFVYTLIGILSAKLIFPSNVGLMSIAFTSILLIPSLAVLLRIEENEETLAAGKFSIRRLFSDHTDIVKVYLLMFLGIFTAYSLTSLVLPEMTISNLFTTQLKTAGIHGFAMSNSLFWNMILNNMLVFVVCFVLSLIYGAGAVLFLTWNASVWGVVFAYYAKQAAGSADGLFREFTCLMSGVLPHMTTEALAYIFAAFVGGIVSKAVLREKLFSPQFYHIVTDAMILLVIGLILVFIAGIIEMNAPFNLFAFCS